MSFTIQSKDGMYWWVDFADHNVKLVSPAEADLSSDYYKFEVNNSSLFSVGDNAYVGPDESLVLFTHPMGGPITTTIADCDGDGDGVIAIGFPDVFGILKFVKKLDFLTACVIDYHGDDLCLFTCNPPIDG